MRGFLSGAIAGVLIVLIGVIGASYVTGPSGPLGQDGAGDDANVVPAPADDVNAEAPASDESPEAESAPDQTAEEPAQDDVAGSAEPGTDTPEPDTAGGDPSETVVETDADAGSVASAPAEDDAPNTNPDGEAEANAPVKTTGETPGAVATEPEATGADPDAATLSADTAETTPDADATAPDLVGTENDASSPDVSLEAGTPLDPPAAGEDSAAISAPGQDEVALLEESPRPEAPAPETSPEVSDAETPSPNVDLGAGTPLDTPSSEDGVEGTPSALSGVATLDDTTLPDQPDAGTTPDVDAAAPEVLAELGTTIETPEVEVISPGILNDRLPQIGDPLPDAEVTQDEADTDADADADTDAIADLPAIDAFAIPFEFPDGQPMMSILLIDPGADARVNPADLSELPVPLSIAVDPREEDAVTLMEAIRAAGHEVVVMTPLSADASPSDVEQAFQVYLEAVPEAVAVLDVPEARLQENRPRAVQIADILTDTGHGLVTYSRGLNSGVQVARAAGVPAMAIFRDIDDGTRQISVMKRLLDVGAFRASQERTVLVTGQLRSAEITALTEWILSTRAATVALVPVSTLLKVQ